MKPYAAGAGVAFLPAVVYGGVLVAQQAGGAPVDEAAAVGQHHELGLQQALVDVEAELVLAAPAHRRAGREAVFEAAGAARRRGEQCQRKQRRPHRRYMLTCSI